MSQVIFELRTAPAGETKVCVHVHGICREVVLVFYHIAGPYGQRWLPAVPSTQSRTKLKNVLLVFLSFYIAYPSLITV